MTKFLPTLLHFSALVAASADIGSFDRDILNKDANIQPFKDYDEEDRSIRPSLSLDPDEDFEEGSFDDEFHHNDNISHVTRSSRASRSSRSSRQYSHQSMQYSSQASSRGLDMDHLGSYYDDDLSRSNNGQLL